MSKGILYLKYFFKSCFSILVIFFRKFEKSIDDFCFLDFLYKVKYQYFKILRGFYLSLLTFVQAHTMWLCVYVLLGGKMKFRPLLDRVVIERIEEQNRTAGGIIIPDTAKEKPSQGIIVAVGPGGRDDNGKEIAMTLKEGDKVLFGKWAGTEIKVEGKDLLIMKESDVLGVLE